MLGTNGLDDNIVKGLTDTGAAPYDANIVQRFTISVDLTRSRLETMSRAIVITGLVLIALPKGSVCGRGGQEPA